MYRRVRSVVGLLFWVSFILGTSMDAIIFIGLVWFSFYTAFLEISKIIVSSRMLIF